MPRSPIHKSGLRPAATAVGLALLLAPAGCTSLAGCSDDADLDAIACRNRVAREQLSFGLSRARARAIMQESEAAAPWENALGVGPERVASPFDGVRYESELGEAYEVLRYPVEAHGVGSCPFVQGRLLLEPLIFVDDQLVGWEWSYLEDALGRPLGDDERAFRFGAFCGDAAQRAPEP